MSYLGNAPARSFISFERQVFTIVNSQTAYALSHSVTNENDIRLVVNNVVQEPGSGKAYTATGTALTLSAALTNGTDEMYCVFLGRATATSAPGAGSIGTAQLASDSVTLAKIVDANVTTAKIADANVTSAKMFSGFANGIAMVDQFKLTSDHSNGVITALARCANTAFGRIGTGMSVSSGVFTFPSTGIYLVMPKVVFRTDSDGDRTMEVFTQVTTNNSSYESIDDIISGDGDVDGNPTNSTACSFVFVDVTDTSNVKVKFFTSSIDQHIEAFEGTYNMTTFTFVRIGDT